jgi:hypothetical protein
VLGEERIFGAGSLELDDSVGIHACIHIEYDFEWNTGGLVTEMDDVLYASGAGYGTSGGIGSDADEHVARKERNEARAPAHEWEEREIQLAAKIELDPSLRARLGVNELPGSIAERRHVGVVHLSSFIHNEGEVQSASGRSAALSLEEYIEKRGRGLAAES